MLLVSALFANTEVRAQALVDKPIPAFPGAEGGGMYTTGGRGGKVLYVTKLDDDGSEGTLRWALRQKYPRIVMFKVSGVIELKSRINLTSGNVTIAGQTAPGEGICIRNHSLMVRAGNVIIRYIRFRMGDETKINDDALGGIRQHNIIIDHCSMSWSTDECASFYANTDFTMQWCLMTESLRHSVHEKGSHGYGGIWGGKNASFHHNMLSCHDNRNPRFDHPFLYNSQYPESEYRGVVDFRNNVIYNWGANNCYGGEGGQFNMVNNYYKPGPASNPKTSYFINTYGLCKDLKGDGQIHDFGHPVLYIAGNHFAGNPNGINNDNRKGIYPAKGGKEAKEQTKPLLINGKEKGHTTTHTAEKAFEKVLSYAGASLFRDDVDLRAVDDAAKGMATIQDGGNGSKNGFIDTQSAVGGWQEYKSLPAPADTDGDGMPDEWEDTHGLDKHNAEDANLIPKGSIGYTNVEIYLNSIVEHITKEQSKLK
ncbi:pectate lyase [Dysgonomonas sp. 511]|uniref:pectate lyase n=1 Tax=Dysgonomonas sp. 511 TaxID=2302930 RepID=UPI0013D52FE1|nr:pectate lyase [Dysgonomonas sp. 511]NDV78201.1 pectate lyase [Dysgonomonas sp. 511]